MSNILLIVQNALDKIPFLIVSLRDLIIKGLTMLHLPTESSLIIFGVFSLFLAYIWIKQFVTGSLMLKLSTLLNLLLLSLLIYVSIVYIK